MQCAMVLFTLDKKYLQFSDTCIMHNIDTCTTFKDEFLTRRQSILQSLQKKLCFRNSDLDSMFLSSLVSRDSGAVGGLTFNRKVIRES